MCISHFSTFFSFLAIFQVLQCMCLIFHVFQYSCHNPGPTIWVCHFSCWLVFSPYYYSVHLSFLTFSVFLTIFQVLHSVFLIFHVFQFSHHSPVPTLGIPHFPGFLVFFAIFQVKQCLCTIFDVFQFSRHIPGPTVYISPFSCFSVFLSIFQVI